MYYSTDFSAAKGWGSIPGMEMVMDVLLEGGGLQEISEAAARALGNPFWIVDMNSKMMVPVAGETNNERLLRESEQGYNTEETMEFVQKEKVRERTSKQDSPYFFTTQDTGERILTCPVRIGNTIVAFVSTIEEKQPFAESVVETIEVIARVVGTELQKSTFYRDNKEIKYSYLLTDLLENLISPANLPSRLKVAGYAVKKHCYLINVELPDVENRQGLLGLIHGQLSTLLGNCMSCLYKYHYVYVVSLSKKLGENDQMLRQLRQFLRETGLKAAISDAFSNLALTAQNYQKTVDALRLGKQVYPEDVLYRYEVLIVDHAMTMLNGQMRYSDFSRGAVDVLAAYDQKHNAELLHTLQTWMEYVFRITPAAQALNIHVNTLRLRLEKIQSLTNLSLDKGDQVFELALALRLYRAEKEKEQYHTD